MNAISTKLSTLPALKNMEIFDYSLLDSETQLSMDMLGVLSPPNSESQDSNSTEGASSLSSNMQSPIFTVDYKPQLLIKEQPTEKFRFRYKSEMAGTHGCLTGRNSDRCKKLSYPTVELLNFHRPAIIRCSLYTTNKDYRSVHAHRLMREDNIDPHDIEVSGDTGYQAIFSNMGIIHTAKKHVADELTKKKQHLLKEKKGRNLALTMQERSEIEREVLEEVKSINLNTVCLCFEAFEKKTDGTLAQICSPAFSDTISNRKSALTGELKICRIDQVVSSCVGGEVIFMFVEKVVKKNIRVRFFEVDQHDNEIWQADGIFSELDVHHQYAIAFKTPPYRNRDIKEPVRVYIELVRPTDGDRSEPKTFMYRPEKHISIGNKRPRFEDSFEIDDLPSTIRTMEETCISDTLDAPSARIAISETAEGLNSEEFNDFLKDMDFETVHEYSNVIGGSFIDIQELKFDGESTTNARVRPRVMGNMSGTRLRAVNRRSKPNVQCVKWDNTDFLIKDVMSQLKAETLSGPSKMLEVLCNEFRKRTTEGDNVLHSAISKKNIDCIRELIKLLGKYDHKNILINQQNCKDETVLHRAFACELPEVARALLNNGADPNKFDCDANFPIHIALSKQSEMATKLVQELVKVKHVKLNEENYKSLTPLRIAVQNGYDEAVKLLVQAGADINHNSSDDGNTVIHVATRENKPLLLTYLLQIPGANVNAQNHCGYTALHYAVTAENLEICKILKHFNADPSITNSDNVRVKEELEDDDDDDKGFSSIQLAFTNKDILNILKTEPMSPSFTPEVIIKNEDVEVNTDMGLFDEICLRKLAACCDGTLVWENLVELLDCTEYLPVLRQAVSPTTMLLSNPDLNASIYQIREFFNALDVHEAVDIIDEMRERQK